MKKIFFLALFFIILIFSSGCIRTSQDIMNENCASLEGISARVSCMKYKAAFLAASGHGYDAIPICMDIKDQYLNFGTDMLSIDNYLAGDSYNSCIKRVAEYSRDENICEMIDSSFTASYTSIIPDILGLVSSSPTSSYFEKDECVKRVRYKNNIKEDIRQNYEIIGFKL